MPEIEGCPSVLRVEVEEEGELRYPPYIDILREVTDEEAYYSYNLC